MARISPLALTRAQDASGNAVSGATLAYYRAGTSTPTAIYSDVNGRLSLGTSLSSDANGFFAVHYLDDPQDYKAIVTIGSVSRVYDWLQDGANSGGGSGVSDADPFVVADITALRAETWGGNVPTLVQLTSNWAAGDGGGLFRLDAADTTTADDGGVVVVDAAGNRWKRQYVGAVVLSWWGQPSANDTTKWTAAVAAAPAGGTLLIPPGTWLLTNAGLAKSVYVVGFGESSILRHIASATAHMINITGTGHKILFRDLTIDGQSSAQTALSQWGSITSTAVGTSGGTDPLCVDFENVEFRNSHRHAFQMLGDKLTNTRERSTFTNCRWYGGTEGSGASYTPQDINCGDGCDLVVINPDADSDSVAGLGRAFLFVGQTDVVARYPSRVEVRGGTIRKRGCNVTQALGAIDLYFAADDSIVDGVTLLDSAYSAIKWKSSGARIRITNNTVRGSSGVGTAIPAINGNASTAAALFADQFSVVGNIIDNWPGYGIVIDALTGGSAYAAGVQISGGSVRVTGLFGVYVNACRDVTVEGVTVLGGQIGICAQNCTGVVGIFDAVCQGQSNYSVYVDNSGAAQDLTVKNVDVADNTNSGNYAVYVSGGRSITLDDVRVRDSVNGVTWVAGTTVLIANSSVTNGSGSVGFASSSGTTTNLHLRGNVTDASTPVTRGTYTNIYEADNSWNGRVLWGSAAPVAGTWSVGDTVINSTPTAGGTDRWRCTTAGTPGTWKAVSVAP